MLDFHSQSHGKKPVYTSNIQIYLETVSNTASFGFDMTKMVLTRENKSLCVCVRVSVRAFPLTGTLAFSVKETSSSRVRFAKKVDGTTVCVHKTFRHSVCVTVKSQTRTIEMNSRTRVM